MLPDRRPPWKEFVFSLGSQSVLIFILLSIGLLHPNVLTPPLRDYTDIWLVTTPHPVNHNPAPVLITKAVPVVEVKTTSAALKLPVRSQRVEHPDPPSVPRIEATNKLPPQPVALVIPKEAIKVNVFSSGSSQAPMMEKPPRGTGQ
jgi:hypothetical protein